MPLRAERGRGVIEPLSAHRSAEESLARFLDGGRRLFVLTGAGCSTASGIPDYRDVDGAWKHRRPTTFQGFVTSEAIRRRYWAGSLVGWQRVAAARPNAAHAALARLEGTGRLHWLLTQNVDGLHRKAGSRNVVDIHGDVHDLLCTRCEYRSTVEDYSHLPPLPRCPECGAPLRPDVVLFGELLPLDKVETIERELRRGFDVVFSIGTTSVFPYIARPVLEAKLRRKATVEVNPGDTLVSGEVDVKLPMRAAEALAALWDRLEEDRG